MKIFEFVKANLKSIVIFVVVFVGIGVAGWAIGGFFPHQSVTQKIIEDNKKLIDKQYEDQLKEKNQEIEMLNQQLADSEKKLKKLSNSLAQLKKRSENVQPPKTNKEARDRLNELGYPPSN